MDPDRGKRLSELGPEALADALLELALRFDAADDLWVGGQGLRIKYW